MIYATDKLKAIILSALLGVPFITAVIYVIKKGGGNFFFWLWLLVFAFQVFLLTIFPTVIAPIFNKCVRPSVCVTLNIHANNNRLNPQQ